MEMFSVKTNLENEKGCIKIIHIKAERTIIDLGIQISYFKHGSVQTVNQYKVNPYIVEFEFYSFTISQCRVLCRHFE